MNSIPGNQEEGAQVEVDEPVRSIDTTRALTGSEVLLLEALHVAERRQSIGYALALVTNRARSHAKAAALAANNHRRLGGSPADAPKLAELIANCERIRDTEISNSETLPTTASTVRNRAVELLDDFARATESFSAGLKEAIEHCLEAEHRRYVVCGDELSNSQSADVVGAQNEGMHQNAFIGLALSGGGIRSASFSIGSLQSLARQNLLTAFDFVSSVSGGGYAAAWMCGWAYRHKGGIGGVQDELYSDGNTDSGPLRWVRRHSAYLAPRLATSMSNDAWALLVAYFSVWLPILLLISLAALTLLLVPQSLLLVALWLSNDSVRPTVEGDRYLVLAVVAGVMVIFIGLLRRLTMFHRVPGDEDRYPVGLPEVIRVGTLVVTVSMALAMPAVAQLLNQVIAAVKAVFPSARALVGFFAVLVFWALLSSLSMVTAEVLSKTPVQRSFDWCRSLFDVHLPSAGPLERSHIPVHRMVLAVALSSLFASASIAALLSREHLHPHSAQILIAFGPFVVFSIFAISALIESVIVHRYQSDADRAWAARIGGWMLSATLGWTVLCFVAIWGNEFARNSFADPIAAVGGVSVLAVLALVIWRLAGPTGTAFFAVTVLVLLGPLRVIDFALSDGNEVIAVAALLVAFVSTSSLAYLVNVNHFSLHAIYKEGLVRTFLGASRLGVRNQSVSVSDEIPVRQRSQFQARRPDPVTSIDQNDDPNLAWLQGGPKRQLPILLLNAAVNGRSLSDKEGRVPRQWPFTFSQYFSGSPAAGIGYTSTDRFFSAEGRGISLGTAMAVSGAAMSPTSGRATKSVHAFLLGILNARLGLWIGNPHFPEKVPKGSPALSGFTILQEMMGLRSKFGPWIHLSDGGHFENLGIYELVRRGCRRIVAIDASCDPDRSFSDLANLIRRTKIDLGITISRTLPWEIFGPKEKSPIRGGKQRAWTWFEIDYGAGLPRGRLLYIKPSVYKGEPLPVEVRHYWSVSPAFPHETTADQFFGEAQMEAYRSLGQEIVKGTLKTVLSPTKTGTTDNYDEDPRMLDVLMRTLKHDSSSAVA